MQIVERTTISDCLISGQVSTESPSLPLDSLPPRVTYEGTCLNEQHGRGVKFSVDEAEARLYDDGYLITHGDVFSETNELFHSILLALDDMGAIPEGAPRQSPKVASFVLDLGREDAIERTERVHSLENDAAEGVQHYAFEREDGSTISLKQGLLSENSVLVEPNEPVDEAAGLISELMSTL